MNEPSLPWSHRPRAKVRNPLLWGLALFWVPVAFLVGIGVILDEDRWWAQGIGGVVSVLSVAIAVAVVMFFRRPVRTHDDIAPLDSDIVATWDATMTRLGRVEIGLSLLRVLKTFGGITVALLGCVVMISGVAGVFGIVLGVITLLLMTFLALVPHVQFVTGGAPAVLIDSSGIEIARWGRLAIPWDDVTRIEVLQSTAAQANTIVRVSPSFFTQDLAARSGLRRLAEAPARSFVTNGYAIPSTTTADPRTLATWLAQEFARRSGEK